MAHHSDRVYIRGNDRRIGGDRRKKTVSEYSKERLGAELAEMVLSEESCRLLGVGTEVSLGGWAQVVAKARELKSKAEGK